MHVTSLAAPLSCSSSLLLFTLLLLISSIQWNIICCDSLTVTKAAIGPIDNSTRSGELALLSKNANDVKLFATISNASFNATEHDNCGFTFFFLFLNNTNSSFNNDGKVSSDKSFKINTTLNMVAHRMNVTGDVDGGDEEEQEEGEMINAMVTVLTDEKAFDKFVKENNLTTFCTFNSSHSSTVVSRRTFIKATKRTTVVIRHMEGPSYSISEFLLWYVMVPLTAIAILAAITGIPKWKALNFDRRNNRNNRRYVAQSSSSSKTKTHRKTFSDTPLMEVPLASINETDQIESSHSLHHQEQVSASFVVHPEQLENQ